MITVKCNDTISTSRTFYFAYTCIGLQLVLFILASINNFSVINLCSFFILEEAFQCIGKSIR